MSGVSQYRRHAGVPDKFKPSRDRRVDAKKVPCPICQAEVGETCRRIDGTPGSGLTHPRRRGMAIRAGF